MLHYSSHSIKKHLHGALILGVLFVVAVSLLSGSDNTRAANTSYLASDVIGQLDVDGNPDFTLGDDLGGTGGYTSDYGLHLITTSLNTTALRFVHGINELYVVDPDRAGIITFPLGAHHASQFLDNIFLFNNYYSVIDDPAHDRTFLARQDNLYGPSIPFPLTCNNNDDICIPADLALDSDNQRLFVADFWYDRVTVFDVTQGAENTHAINEVGQPDMATTSIAVMPASIFYHPPTGLLFVNNIAYDARIPVSPDATYCRVITNGIVDGMAPSCTFPNFSGTGYAYDPVQDHFFASLANGAQVGMFDISNPDDIADNMTPIAIFGDLDVATGTSQSALSSPSALEFHDHKLYVADSGNHRVMIYSFISITTSTVSDGTEGDLYTESIDTNNDQGTVSLELVSGSLPPGLTLSGNEITGTPTLAGAYSFALRAVDTTDAGTFYSDSSSYSMTVAAATPGTSGSSGSSGSSTSGSSTTSGSSGGAVIIPGTSGTGTGSNGSSSSGSGAGMGGTGATPAQCSDGVDNDHDGKIDWPADAGCKNALSNTEVNTMPPKACNDGKDNDADGLKDMNDPGCQNKSDEDETDPPKMACGNSVDDDADGFVDMADRGCTDQLDNDEYDATSDHCVTDPASCGGSIVTPSCNSSSDCIVKGGTFSLKEEVLKRAGKIQGMMLHKSNSTILASMALVLLGWFICMFGWRKRHRPWGQVYDSVTKQPIPKAHIILEDMDGKVVARTITDRVGRYGFMVEPGKYRLLLKMRKYSFPSLKLVGKTQDEGYTNLYFGHELEIKKQGEVIAKNIPMDPIR